MTFELGIFDFVIELKLITTINWTECNTSFWGYSQPTVRKSKIPSQCLPVSIDKVPNWLVF